MSNKNPIILPISGSMAMPKHSKRLEMALRNYITSIGGHYYDDQMNKGILTSYFKLDHGICVEQKVYIRQAEYVCHTILSIHTTPENTEQMIRYIAIANNINTELDYGNFEVDTTTGDIRFRSYYEPIDIVRMEAFDKLLGYPRHVINEYGQYFLEE